MRPAALDRLRPARLLSQNGSAAAARAAWSCLAKSIGALGSLDPDRGLALTLQQVTDAAKRLFRAEAAGLMLVDQDGQLRWASASDQTAQTVEDGQERLAQGPCAVAFSQRLPAAIRNIHTEPDWNEFAQVLISEAVVAALSVPVELDGGVIGTLDLYAGQARDWDPGEVAALQAYAGLVASLLMAAVIAQVKGRLADVARDVTRGQPLPASRSDLARGRAEQAKDRETAT